MDDDVYELVFKLFSLLIDADTNASLLFQRTVVVTWVLHKYTKRHDIFSDNSGMWIKLLLTNNNVQKIKKIDKNLDR